MLNHDMRLQEEPYNLIKNNFKNIEYRVNDPKRQKIKIGDTITFYKLAYDGEYFKVLITDLKYYKNLLEMYTENFDRDFKDRYENPQAVADDTPYYSKEEIEQYGCIAIYFKKL